MKPDRFARLVGQHRHIACDGMGYVLLEDTARHLLRLEHRAVARLVKRLRGKAGLRTQYQKGRHVDSPMTSYTLACDDILAAMKE